MHLVHLSNLVYDLIREVEICALAPIIKSKKERTHNRLRITLDYKTPTHDEEYSQVSYGADCASKFRPTSPYSMWATKRAKEEFMVLFSKDDLTDPLCKWNAERRNTETSVPKWKIAVPVGIKVGLPLKMRNRLVSTLAIGWAFGKIPKDNAILEGIYGTKAAENKQKIQCLLARTPWDSNAPRETEGIIYSNQTPRRG